MNKEQKELIKKLGLVKAEIQKYPVIEKNKDGNIICETFTDGTKYEYNSNGKLICETFANGTKYEYNSNGNIICNTYADGTKYTYEYNSDGNIICNTYADGKYLINGVYYEKGGD